MADGTEAKSVDVPMISSKGLLTISGALWTFFGLAVFSLIKEVLLNEHFQSVTPAVRHWLSVGTIALFAVNFSALVLFQGCGVILALKEIPGGWKPAVYLVNAILLVGYLTIAFATYSALSAAGEHA